MAYLPIDQRINIYSPYICSQCGAPARKQICCHCKAGKCRGGKTLRVSAWLSPGSIRAEQIKTHFDERGVSYKILTHEDGDKIAFETV